MSTHHQKYVAMIGDNELSLFDKVEAWVGALRTHVDASLSTQ